MNSVLLTVGRAKAAYVADGLADYARRLTPHGGCELAWVKSVRAAKGLTDAAIMAEEGKRLLARLEPRDTLWALDRQGAAWTSEQWARQLEQAQVSGGRRLVLVIGGPLGLDQALLARAQRRVSLGPPTLAHELAALVALEQLYRAHGILAGSPYHK
jgi:23S rRNA (pseudouridine1915-N3)-methyltransferase